MPTPVMIATIPRAPHTLPAMMAVLLDALADGEDLFKIRYSLLSWNEKYLRGYQSVGWYWYAEMIRFMFYFSGKEKTHMLRAVL